MAIRIKPGTRKAAYYITIVLVIYWLVIRKRKITEKFEININAADPKVVWEYWADFSNFQKINPTIINFEIDYERGTYENWEYGVTYLEQLTLLPFNVKLVGKYRVTPEKKRGHFSEPYRILSENDACLWGVFCTHSDTDLTFLKLVNSKTTKVMEIVVMDCPPMFEWYQRAEYRRQRKHLTEQLKEIDFSSAK